MCNLDDCIVCGEDAHLMCRFIKMKAITQLLTKRAGRQKDFLQEINKIESSFIEQLINSKAELTKKYYLGDL